MCPFCGTRTFLPERSNRVGLMFLAIMKDDAYIYNNNVITCIFWCKILGRADALNCAALRLSCIVIITSLHRYNCFLASDKLRYCYHPSYPCQFARRGMWWGRGYLLHLRTWEGAESYRCHQEKKSWDIIRKCFITKINVSKSAFLKFYLYFCSVIQNFVLFLQHDNKQNVWIWQASRCTNRVA